MSLPNSATPRLLLTLLKADKEALASIEQLEDTAEGLRRIALMLRANLASRLPPYTPVE
jgi:hypothetical protein